MRKFVKWYRFLDKINQLCHIPPKNRTDKAVYPSHRVNDMNLVKRNVTIRFKIVVQFGHNIAEEGYADSTDQGFKRH